MSGAKVGGPKKINFSREAARNQESGAFLEQSLPTRDRAAVRSVAYLSPEKRNELGKWRAGLRAREGSGRDSCSRNRANNGRRRALLSASSVPCDPRILRSHRISNGRFDALVDAIDSRNQTKGFTTLSR